MYPFTYYYYYTQYHSPPHIPTDKKKRNKFSFYTHTHVCKYIIKYNTTETEKTHLPVSSINLIHCTKLANKKSTYKHSLTKRFLALIYERDMCDVYTHSYFATLYDFLFTKRSWRKKLGTLCAYGGSKLLPVYSPPPKRT